MPLTLISSENLPLDKICESLIDEGVPKAQISCSRVNEFLAGTDDAITKSDLIILVSTTQEFILTGGTIDSIRNRLNAEQRLVVCMPRPVDYQRVLDLGVDEVISPASPTTERIVERLLGHLILAKYITPSSYESLFGATNFMRQVYDKIDAYAERGQTVLLLGETGTGKGLTSLALHTKANRRGEFILINCGNVPGELKDSLLFGHLKGAFTGANETRKGLIERAQNGTAFFDEIGDLNVTLQTTLLDVLDHNRVRPVGATTYIPVNACFVFATHQDLKKLMEERAFRQDLFERINVLDISLPPLRERKADIPLLVDHFIEKENKKFASAVKLGPGAVDELFRYEWRRNVRELSNVVTKAAVLAGKNAVITDIMLRESLRNYNDAPPEPQATGQSGKEFSFDPQIDTWPQARDRLERQYFRLLWNQTNGDHKEIARLSDLSRSQVFEKLKKHKISKSDQQNTDNSSND